MEYYEFSSRNEVWRAINDVIISCHYDAQKKIAQNKLTKARRKEAVHGWIIATRENSVALVPHTTSWDESEMEMICLIEPGQILEDWKIINSNNIFCKCYVMKLENLTCSIGKSISVFSSSSISIESFFLSIGGKGRLTGQHVNFFVELCNWPLVGLLLILLSSFFFGLRSFDTTRTGCVKVMYKLVSHWGKNNLNSLLFDPFRLIIQRSTKQLNSNNREKLSENLNCTSHCL